MKKKTKIALCISGESRNAMYSFPYIYETFLRSNFMFETDVFIHTRSHYRALNLYQPKNYITDNTPIQQITSSIFTEENISKLPDWLYQQFTASTQLSHNSDPLSNQTLQWDSIKKVFDLSFNFNKYDLYVRIRPDLIFKSKFNLHGIISDIVIQKRYNIFIPNYWHSLNQKFEDTFAIGDYDSMYHYSRFFDNYISLCIKNNTFEPEILLFNYLNNNKNIKISGYDTDTALVRNNTSLLHTISPDPFIEDDNTIYEN